MAERDAIVAMWHAAQDASAVLATLIQVAGSSYRKAGAHMYIQSPNYVGSISGGCLEGEVVRKAAWLVRNGATVERYSTVFDESTMESTGNLPYGLGCGGVLDLLLEPVALPEAQALLTAMETAQQGGILSSATLLPSPRDGQAICRVVLCKGSQAVLYKEPTLSFSSGSLSAAAREILVLHAKNGTEASTSSITLDGQDRSLYVEPILPPQRLVIFGAGDDALPLANIAHQMGWRVAIADGRSWLAQDARFPTAELMLTLREDPQHFGSLDLSDLRLTNQDAVAILTHSFEQDRRLLCRLLPLDLRYLGLLGAQRRSQLLLREAAQSLGWTPEECLRRTRSPIGLDLGGDSPEAVALAIVAEIQSVLHHKSAVSRGMSQDTLYVPPATPYIPMRCALEQRLQDDDAPRTF